ncbi:MAG: hypothetical protein R3D90_01600 [Paracoccaceae bacterium]
MTEPRPIMARLRAIVLSALALLMAAQVALATFPHEAPVAPGELRLTLCADGTGPKSIVIRIADGQPVEGKSSAANADCPLCVMGAAQVTAEFAPLQRPLSRGRAIVRPPVIAVLAQGTQDPAHAIRAPPMPVLIA